MPGITVADLESLLESWTLHLRAERKSPATVKTYTDGVRAYLTWVDLRASNDAGDQQAKTDDQQGSVNDGDLRASNDAGDRLLSRSSVNRFTAHLLDGGAEAATARSRQLSVRRFSAWLAAEGEIPVDELVTLKPPKLDVKVVEALTDPQLAALAKACAGRDLRDKRDEAILRLMAETGARAGEVVALQVADVNVSTGMVTIRRGKGGKGRTVLIGPLAQRAMDRYLRARRSHPLAHTTPLWLGESGRGFGYDALRATMMWRAEKAGLGPKFKLHTLRHTAASRWLAKGGSEGGLMAVAGWSRREMVDRYTRATSQQRAADEARRLDLGEF